MKANKKNYIKGTKIDENMTDNNSKQQLPAKKASESKVKKQSQRINVFQISAQFLRDARTELKKVKWPTKKELTASTTMVVILVLIVALYLGLVDFGLVNIINRIVG